MKTIARATKRTTLKVQQTRLRLGLEPSTSFSWRRARPYLAGAGTTAIQVAGLLQSLGCANELLF
jgi:hypothetical protein